MLESAITRSCHAPGESAVQVADRGGRGRCPGPLEVQTSPYTCPSREADLLRESRDAMWPVFVKTKTTTPTPKLLAENQIALIIHSSSAMANRNITYVSNPVHRWYAEF
jgi:hypothetical protein